MTPTRSPAYAIDALFTERWSPRAFTGEPIAQETLFTFFEAARWAPSGFNAQPWRFVWGRAGTPAFRDILDTLLPFNQDWAHKASALVAVLSVTRWTPPGKTQPQAIASHSFDAGAAWASLAFQATLSGWHAHGIGGFDRDGLRRRLAVPEDVSIEAVVAIGRRGDVSQLNAALQARETPNGRQPLDALVFEGRWGG